MGLKTILKKFFHGYVVLEEVESAINGKIEVREGWFGRRNLVVGGISQSGDTVEKIWSVGLGEIRNWELGISDCLVLGLGAGSAAKLINKNWPRARITGIEIDPEIIRLGKKYFGLGEITNLSVIVGDAFSLITNYQLLITNYDLILVDLYLGDQVPKGAETEEFIKQIKQCLRPAGWVIFNRLYYANKKEKTDKFSEKLKKYFVQVEAKNVSTNKLFLCQK